jgi:exopolysaccharide biosynthesis WecB/TagA/CpsF family protein
MQIEKRSLFGINIAITDYDLASDVIIENAVRKKSFGVSALAVHGLVSAVRNKELGTLVNKIDLIVPDGQPVRWALNSFHNVDLKERVYGPTLMLHVLKKAEKNNLNIYLFGSTAQILDKLSDFIKSNYKKANLVGRHADRFREATPEEDVEDVHKIKASGAHIVLVGRGCPRQEVWVAEHLGKINAVMIAVGAAFDFLAGTLKQAPSWMQDHGLEWLFRLITEPRRLWKRYLLTNSFFIYLFLKHKVSRRV